MSDYTPSTDEVWEMVNTFVPNDAFDRWLKVHDGYVRDMERARIARDMDAEQRRARAAHQSAPTDHFAHDYCRWVGHAEAFGTAARIAREGA